MARGTGGDVASTPPEASRTASSWSRSGPGGPEPPPKARRGAPKRSQESLPGQGPRTNLLFTPPHEVTIPYTRMLAGPMDFTPGAMRASSRANWKAVSDLPSSQGTVARQLAMYVLYETSLPMLSDMPTAYERSPDALDFLKAVPVTWDETIGLDGRIGEFAVLARRKGADWWLAAMTDWDRRTADVPLGFLGDGTWEATLWSDGPNADKLGTDYRRRVVTVSPGAALRLDLAPGGGAALRLRRR